MSNNSNNITLKDDENSNIGPVYRQNRRCTDVIFILILIVMWTAVTFVGLASTGIIKSDYIVKGNPNRLVRGIDYYGNICGVDNMVLDYPNKYLPNSIGINADNNGDIVPIMYGICVQECPLLGDTITDPVSKSRAWVVKVSTYNFYNYCIPYNTKPSIDSVSSVFADIIQTTTVQFVLGFSLSIIFSLLFLFIIRIPLILRFTVWLSVLFVFLIMILGSYTFLSKLQPDDRNTRLNLATDPLEVTLTKLMAGLFIAASVLWIALILLLRDRIALAIGLVRESSKALLQMPILTMLPLFHVGIFGVITIVFSIYCAYLASSGEISTHYNSMTGISYKEITFTSAARNTIAFVIFVYLWTIGFLEAMGHLLSSHAILTWYFADDKTLIGSSQACKSAYISCRYHAGTAAIGSFLIAILRGIRIILEYVQHKLETLSNQSPSKGCCSCTCGVGTLARFVLCTFSCCLCCFEGFVRFVNKHAYIQTSFYGTGFYSSAKRAFFLLVRNLGRVAAVTMIADFVLLTGKLSITLSCAGIAYYYIEHNMEDKVSSKIIPSLFVAFIAFGCSTLFLGVASAACDTILQAYIIDEEMLNNSDIEEKSSSNPFGKKRELDTSLRDHIEEQRRFAIGESIDVEREPLTPRNSDSVEMSRL